MIEKQKQAKLGTGIKKNEKNRSVLKDTRERLTKIWNASDSLILSSGF